KIDSTSGLPMWVKWFGKDIISSDGLKAQLDTRQAIPALAFTKEIINAEGGWNKFKALRDTMGFFGFPLRKSTIPCCRISAQDAVPALGAEPVRQPVLHLPAAPVLLASCRRSGRPDDPAHLPAQPAPLHRAAPHN